MRLPLGLILAAAVFAIGCHDRKVATLDERARPEKPEDAPVAVFYAQKPDRAFEQIAVFRDEADDMEGFIRRAKKICRRRGGDAIIVRPDSGMWMDQTRFSHHTEEGTTAEAMIVVWSEQVGTAQAAQAER